MPEGAARPPAPSDFVARVLAKAKQRPTPRPGPLAWLRRRPLAEELQESFRTAKEPVYRELAEVLLAEGQLLEAQQVLDLLKEEEYSDFVRRDASAAAAVQGRTALTPEETAWAARYRVIADRLVALATEYGALRSKPGRTADELQRLGALEANLSVARQAFEQFLAHLDLEVRQVPQVQERIARLTNASFVKDITHLLQGGHFQAIGLVDEHQGSRIGDLEDLLVIFPGQSHRLRCWFCKWLPRRIGEILYARRDLLAE